MQRDEHQAFEHQDGQWEQDTVQALGDTFLVDRPRVEVDPCTARVEAVGVDSQACRAAFGPVAFPYQASATDHVTDTFASAVPFAFASLSLRLAFAALPIGVDIANIPASFYA